MMLSKKWFILVIVILASLFHSSELLPHHPLLQDDRILSRNRRFAVSKSGFMNLVGYISSVLNIYNIYDIRGNACKKGGICAAKEYSDQVLSLLYDMNYQMSVLQDSLKQTNLRIDEYNKIGYQPRKQVVLKNKLDSDWRPVATTYRSTPPSSSATELGYKQNSILKRTV